ncbi:MAG: YIP1 family protein [Thermomicrobiales bacterium]
MNQAGPFSDRIVGVLRLVPATYREIARDTTATTQALVVVALAVVAGAIGGAGEGVKGIIGGAIGAIISWLIVGVATWFVGTRLMGAPDIGGGPGRTLRTTGFAKAPQFLLVLGFIPVIGLIAAVVAWVWGIITGVLAVREALGISTGKAIVTIIVAAVLLGIVASILLLFGIGIYGFSQ